MPDPQPFDVKKAIEQSSTKSTLQELAKRGIHRVKVLDEQAIRRLIEEAVSRSVSTKTDLLSADDRAKLIEESRRELDRLMAEQRQLKDKAELMEREKNSLVSEVENLQKQLQMQRKLGDDTARQRYEDGKNVMRAEVEDMKKKMASMEEEITRRVRREVELEYQAKTAAQNATIEQMKADLSRRESELRERYEARERQLREELSRREADIAARGASMKEAELRAKLDEMNAKNIEMAQRQTQLLEEMKKSDEELFKKMTELFTKAIDGVSKKLTDLRLRAVAGGPVGVGAIPGEVEFRPSQATIEGMLSAELDSHLKQMQVEGKSAGKLGSALERLKALRGGGEAKKEDKGEEKK